MKGGYMSDDRFTRNAPIARSYASELLTIDHGEGVYLFDRSGNRYLDFGSGIAVNSFGYGDMGIAQAAFEQMKRCVHVSNLYTTEQTVSLARRLVSTGSFDGVHFGNSGTEAIEAAIKYARLYANRTSGPEKAPAHLLHPRVSREDHGRPSPARPIRSTATPTSP
jgi:acetylornithine/N-succinyldiaminopimelate aminotransferase